MSKEQIEKALEQGKVVVIRSDTPVNIDIKPKDKAVVITRKVKP